MKSYKWLCHRPLKSRKFLLYWIGQLISFTGTQMQLWSFILASTLANRPAPVNQYYWFVRFLPLILLSLLAGVVADHYNRRKITILTQIAQVIAAVALGIHHRWRQNYPLDAVRAGGCAGCCGHIRYTRPGRLSSLHWFRKKIYLARISYSIPPKLGVSSALQLSGFVIVFLDFNGLIG